MILFGQICPRLLLSSEGKHPQFLIQAKLIQDVPPFLSPKGILSQNLKGKNLLFFKKFLHEIMMLKKLWISMTAMTGQL